MNRFFGRGALLFVLIVGLLPNLFFLAVMPFFIAERAISPMLYVTAAVASFFVPRLAVYVLFALVVVVDLGLIVMVAFHLPLAMAIDSLRYMATIDVAASGFYIAVVAINLSLALLSAWLFVRHRDEMRLASPLPVAFVALALMGADFRFNLPYVMKTVPPFDSAVTQNKLDADAIAARGNNLLIVMVEGLGAFAEAAEREVLAGKLEWAAAAGSYTLTNGTTHYSGSTTGAASRELCGRWGDHRDYIAGSDNVSCLPWLLRKRNFETVAYHGYTSDMFERRDWYPKIGFGEMHFLEEMVRDSGERVVGRCGSVFRGLCDRDVAELVHERLLAPGETPKFVYWLTLNSHIPFVEKKDGGLACGSPAGVIANETVCKLTELWSDVFDGVAAIASDPRLPATDILVVGDHHTPLWERDAKGRFKLGEVDWYFLRSQKTRSDQDVAFRFGSVPFRSTSSDAAF